MENIYLGDTEYLNKKKIKILPLYSDYLNKINSHTNNPISPKMKKIILIIIFTYIC